MLLVRFLFTKSTTLGESVALWPWQDCDVRGLDMMKKWPWMRDLPTCIWAGRGWAYDANGLRRLSSAGGADAMQGVEVWESVGTGPEEVEGKVEVARGCVERPLGEPGAVPQLAETPSRIQRHNVAKQSGVPGVTWNGSMWAWEVRWPKLDAKGKIKGQTGRGFSISSFMKQGLTEDEADAAALEVAKAFRADLVRQGLVKEPKAKDPQFTSDVVGVRWDKVAKKWRVELVPKQTKGTEGPKKIQGGHFTEKAAAEAKALELAEAHGLQRSVRAVGRFEELREVQPKVPHPGVKWELTEQQWRAQIRIHGAKRMFRVKPKNFSEAELDRSFQEAVAWKKKQEKEKLRKAKG